MLRCVLPTGATTGKTPAVCLEDINRSGYHSETPPSKHRRIQGIQPRHLSRVPKPHSSSLQIQRYRASKPARSADSISGGASRSHGVRDDQIHMAAPRFARHGVSKLCFSIN